MRSIQSLVVVRFDSLPRLVQVGERDLRYHQWSITHCGFFFPIDSKRFTLDVTLLFISISGYFFFLPGLRIYSNP